MQLGFIIDHSKCIGCHACTIACKAENDVPVGSFRTWVKYTEQGTFPEVRRSFAVLRCNQCSDAPCVEICPVHALEKRPDGIVDVDPERCIGCKSCMQGCPYDALYLNDESGTAEKCHFCAHRTEQGLAPACAVVCPTEAIIPGDFHDPESGVSKMRAAESLAARKTEAGTGPNVFYREATSAGLNPMETQAGGGLIWANQIPGVQLDTQVFEAAEQKAKARTVYDVEHQPLWGRRVSAYLMTKSIAAGAPIGSLWLLLRGADSASDSPLASIGLWIGLAFLTITGLLLIMDLKRPERFWYILRYPNWNSWLTRGTVILMIFGALVCLWIALPLFGLQPAGAVGALLAVATSIAGIATACYTGWLFGQAKGRVLWMRRSLALELALHALLAGAAVWILLALLLPAELVTEPFIKLIRVVAVSTTALQLILGGLGSRMSPRRREDEYRRVWALLTRGPFAKLHRLQSLLFFVGMIAVALPGAAIISAAGAALILIALTLEQDTLVRAGQASSIS